MGRSTSYNIFLFAGFRTLCVKPLVLLCAFVSLWFNSFSQRRDISLNGNWYSIATSNDKLLPPDSYQSSIKDNWQKVDIPHNWDQYEGYRRLLHGNRHGDSWYRKTFSIAQKKAGKRFFLFFEGVGSYATVYLNEKYVGEHAGGRTTFTIDITDVIKTDGTTNEVAVRAYHPSKIKDLPWVCGGCSEERGFSEGSQPMGIFRPVHLVITNDIRIEPFGVHAWVDIKNDKANLFINTTIKNYSRKKRNITIVHELVSKEGKIVAQISSKKDFLPNDSITISQTPYLSVSRFHPWSVEDPYLYKIVSVIKENDIVIDQKETDFGFRTINWRTATNQFYLNGKPVFINGVAEYEHLLGQSHAFSNQQVIARMKWLQAAGFNAFRDGHQPHNLLYGKLCNELGILWWTQLSAHVWYDTPAFRKQFKQLLKEWVIERRNDPAVVLWGLQNESKLPEDFAKECTELIRSLDPTTSSQRLVTTCNGGNGTDWDVPQNWTGTYGGDPKRYANDLKKQILVGEYGAWRTLDLHTEGGFVQNGVYSEDRMTQLMEQKIRLAESVKDSVAGHFFWLLTSHDNPGRVQGGEGLRELDRIGPVNYKGLLTPWEEPTDAFYMYRSNYASKENEPMVYIVSHTWPNRWMQPGVKDSIYVYSNCDEVELFNDINNESLGRRKRNGIGTHFQWDRVEIKYNLLYAVGYVNGKIVAKDTIVLNHLPPSPNFSKLFVKSTSVTKSRAGYNYIYRINCGGPDYKDENGNQWKTDKGFASSWTRDFAGMPAEFASQRRTFSPVKGSKDWNLFQTFRYGRDKLQYEFRLPDGEYLVEFYFIEPWLGVGGGMNAKGMRIFDVAINGKTVLDDLDIWSDAGTNQVLKKIVKAKIVGGKMIISFPEVKVAQALISAIAIASLRQQAKAVNPPSLIANLSCNNCSLQSWMDIGDKPFANGDEQFNSLPSNLYGAHWIQAAKQPSKKNLSFSIAEDADVFIAPSNDKLKPGDFENTSTQIITDENGGKRYTVFRKRFNKNARIEVVDSLLVMIQPATTMQPAYDLKPVTQYKTNVARLGEGVQKEQFAGRGCAVIKGNNKVTVEWPIQTGVADIYSITMKYFYGSGTPATGKLQLIGAGNTMMLDETVQFSFTNPGKWNQFTVNTGNMINAGNYTVRLVIDRAAELAISGIDIQ